MKNHFLKKTRRIRHGGGDVGVTVHHHCIQRSSRVVVVMMLLLVVVTASSVRAAGFVAGRKRSILEKMIQKDHPFVISSSSMLISERNHHAAAFSSSSSSSTATTTLAMNRQQRYRPSSYDDEDDHNHDNRQREQSTERPTQTMTERPEPNVMPSKPKIVVLGASGKIGRLVVRQLLESNLDATIVAFVRDYDKAIRVLYDDMVVLRSKKNPGPKLQIIEGNLVPPQELPGYDHNSLLEQEEEEEADWLKRAQSAAAFYGKSVKDYNDGKASLSSNNSNNNESNRNNSSNDESSLQEAIKGCTTIISCVGSVRPTNIWTDWLSRPLIRILQHDVSCWCTDPRHPYYVAFVTTRKALELAEREQLRREVATASTTENERDHDASSSSTTALRRRKEKNQSTPPPRIRFIRISDLCVAQKPWQFIPVLTNMFHSMVFRYQDMTERLLESSTLIDTIIVRPGDLVDDERDVKTTSLQVNPSGHVPTPARVGRSDVAALAVAAALFQSKEETSSSQQQLTSSSADSTFNGQQHQQNELEQQQQPQPPFHYTLAVRWAGGSEAMSPYPAQGSMKNGLPTATLCMQAALKSLRRKEKGKHMRRKPQESLTSVMSSSSSLSSSYSATVLEFAKSKIQRGHRKKMKPWGIFVALPVYIGLFLMLRNMTTILYMALSSYIPGFTTHIVAPTMARITATATMMIHYVWHYLGSLTQSLTAAFPTRLIQKWLRLPGYSCSSHTYISI